MSAAPAHGRKRKIRKTGRHSTPSPANKAARRAGLAFPAVAVVGALAATPQVRHLVSPGAAAAPAGHLAVSRAVAADQIGQPSLGDAASFRSETHYAQRAKTSSAASRAEARAREAAAAKAAARAAAARTAARAAAAKAAAARRASHAAASHPASSPSPRASAAPASGTPSCTGSGGMLPENVAQIVGFLTAHGYSDNAAAGIAGNMYQESGGNPESGGDGGGGLIGWTPLPPGLVTGNVAADLQTQLEAVLTFNDNWSQYLPALNAAASPAAAADVYVTDFERAGDPVASTREASADAVAAACHI